MYVYGYVKWESIGEAVLGGGGGGGGGGLVQP